MQEDVSIRKNLRTPLSPPTLCRSTPITTTGLSFTVRMNAEGASKIRLIVA